MNLGRNINVATGNKDTNMRLVINLKLPKSIVREMDVYKKKYHPSGLSHSHAHITLVPPFVLRGGMSQLIDDVKHRLQIIGRFSIQINGISSFEDKVLFLKPTCPRELKKLHARLKGIVGAKYRRRTRYSYWKFSAYRPHVTVAQDSARYIRQYRKDLQTIHYKRKFIVTGIGLYVQRKDNRWILKKEFVFRKK